MSRLLSQIMLAILLFPLAGIVYFVVFVTFCEIIRWGPDRFETACVISGVTTWAFIACYWTLLWRKTVQWNASRVGWTVGCFIAAGIIALVVGGLVEEAENDVGFFLGSVTGPILWQIGTVFVWRDNDAERSTRHRSPGAMGATSFTIVCPTCTYNMTGLKGTRCPECGSEFTLDQLFANQPGKASQELES